MRVEKLPDALAAFLAFVFSRGSGGEIFYFLMMSSLISLSKYSGEIVFCVRKRRIKDILS